MGAWIAVVFCTLYMLNPAGGLLEPIPDIVPAIGNLDEAGVMVLLFQAIRKLRAGRKHAT